MTEYGPPAELLVPAAVPPVVVVGPAPDTSGSDASPDELLQEVLATVDVAQDDALIELNRRYAQMYARANPQVLSPPPALIAGTVGPIHVDRDLWTPLVEGVVATFLRRDGEGDPAVLEQRFDGACDEQFRRNLRRAADVLYSVPALLRQIRAVVPDASEGEALAELNARRLAMWLAPRRSATQADLPADLTATGSAASVLIDTDLRSGLVDGALATLLARQGQDVSTLEGRFQAATTTYVRRVRRSVSGVGPDTILLP
jgi:hypothetical protein